jgi:RNA polymerase sigma factor (sigma-70 family)
MGMAAPVILLNRLTTESDSQLLQRFVERNDEDAFAALVHRHGPLVWGACRRRLRNDADAEDAFQATFLVLTRRARAIQHRPALAAWLHTVALNVAREAARSSQRRDVRERQTARTESILEPDHLEDAELSLVLDQELLALSRTERDLLLRCDVQSQTHVQTAQALGWPTGSVSRRLGQARDRLRRRLLQRGVTAVVTGVGAATLSPPSALATSTIRLACLFAAGAAPVHPRLAHLANAGTVGWFTTKTYLAVVGLSIVLMTTWAAGFARTPADPQPPTSTTTRPQVEIQDPEALPPGAIARLGTQRLRHGFDFAYVLSKDGKTLYTLGAELFRVWEMPSGKMLYQCRDRSFIHYNPQLSPNGRWLADQYEQLYLFDTVEKKVVRTFGEAGVRILTFSPDSRFLLAASRHELHWYDITTGNVTRRWKLPEEMHIHQALLGKNGTQLLTASWHPKPAACWWDVATGTVVEKKNYEGQQRRSGLFSPDGTRLMLRISAVREPLQLVDPLSGEVLHRLPGPPDATAYNWAFSSDSKSLIAHWRKDDGPTSKLIVWDTSTGQVKKQLEVPNSGSLRFLPDNRTILVEKPPGLELWDTETGKPLYSELAHSSMVNALHFSPDRSSLFSWGGNLIQWDLKTGKALQQFNQKRVGGGFLSNDGTLLVSLEGVNRMTQVRGVDVATGKELYHLDIPDDTGMYGPHFHQITPGLGDRSFFLYLGRGRLQLAGQAPIPGWEERWEVDLKTGQLIWKSPRRDYGSGDSLLPGGRHLLRMNINREYAGRDPLENEKAIPLSQQFSLALSDLKTLRPTRIIPMPASGQGSYSQFLSSQGGILVTATTRQMGKDEQGLNQNAHTVHLWETATGKQRLAMELPAGVYSMSTSKFTHDERRLVSTTGSSGRLFMWDAVAGKLLWNQQTPVTPYSSLAFSPDDKQLASGHQDSTILLWDVSKYQPTRFPANATDAELTTWWQHLAGDDAKQAYQAIWRLTDAGPKATAFLARHIQPVPALDPARVQQWIADLDHKDFARRDTALQELTRAGEQAEPALEQALKAAPSTEQRSRLERLWNQPVVYPPPTLQLLRALEVLEHQATADAKALVHRLAQGAPTSDVTRRANDVLHRLK